MQRDINKMKESMIVNSVMVIKSNSSLIVIPNLRIYFDLRLNSMNRSTVEGEGGFFKGFGEGRVGCDGAG